jgi:hypothetical protein
MSTLSKHLSRASMMDSESRFCHFKRGVRAWGKNLFNRAVRRSWSLEVHAEMAGMEWEDEQEILAAQALAQQIEDDLFWNDFNDRFMEESRADSFIDDDFYIYMAQDSILESRQAAMIELDRYLTGFYDSEEVEQEVEVDDEIEDTSPLLPTFEQWANRKAC